MIDQPGRYLTRYMGPELEVVVDYKFAAVNLGEDWLVLSVAVSGRESASQEIRNDAVSVRTPRGTQIPLPTQEEFGEAYAEVRSISRRAALASDPLEFTRGGRQPCELDFLRLPGTGVTRTSVFVNHRRLCVGLLYFPVPGGVQPGTWRLRIELEEADVVVPFRLDVGVQ